jgi:hypothetical protein
MKLLSLMDGLLRDRNTLYEQAAQGTNLAALFARLMLVFALTAALYGACMGTYRMFHPYYFFSDFELRGEQHEPLQGDIAGINPLTKTIYTHRTDLPKLTTADIRFNVSEPSEPMTVQEIGVEKGYGKIVLAPTENIAELQPWKIPPYVALKAPLLFLLTLLVCAPALYVLNLLFDIRLHFMPVMVLMAFALASTGTVLAVFVPIAGLFSVVTDSYHFMKIFHVGVFAVAGAFGVKVLSEGLVKLTAENRKGVKPLMMSWLLLYCLVGAQIAWSLKPFLGTPYLPATPPFRVDTGNVYVSGFQSFFQMTKVRSSNSD